METKYTKQKWAVSRETNGLFVHAKNTHNDFNDAICLIYEGTNNHAPEAEANAKLIASAPKLYEALQEILEYMKDDMESQSNAFIKAREALKAATE